MHEQVSLKAPALAVRGGQPDYRKVYDWMRREWATRRPGSFTALADELGTTKQLVSMWATGSGGASQPPMWVLQWLCWQLGLTLVVAPDGVSVHEDERAVWRRTRRRPTGHQDPAPVLAVRGVQPDYRKVYEWMRAEWRRRSGLRYEDLAGQIGTTKNLIAQWATGSGGASQPPMWVLQWLCWQLGLVLVISPDGVTLHEGDGDVVPVVPERTEGGEE